MSQNIMTVFYAVCSLCAAKTATTLHGMDTTLPLKVSCGIWQQDISSTFLAIHVM